MGNPITPEPDDIEDAKWYCVTTQSYLVFPADDGCDGQYANTVSCCVEGVRLKDVIVNGQCKKGVTICVMSTGNVERIIKTKGPYDTVEECHENCP